MVASVATVVALTGCLGDGDDEKPVPPKAISVTEALQTQPLKDVVVRGFLIAPIDAEDRLCARPSETECRGEPALIVERLDARAFPGLRLWLEEPKAVRDVLRVVRADERVRSARIVSTDRIAGPSPYVLVRPPSAAVAERALEAGGVDFVSCEAPP